MYPCVLIILDGWGWRPESKDNAIIAANPKNFDKYFEKYPSTILDASGLAVGLPRDTIGNSEVGHLHIGAGRTVNQLLTEINLAIENGSFFKNPVIREIFKRAKASGTLHLMGLLSDGGVHSYEDHLYALIGGAKKEGISDIAIHAFLDGRDTPPRSGIKYIEKLLAKLGSDNIRLATFTGRYYAMDRDKRWDRISLAYRALVFGEGIETNSPLDALRASYKQGVGDEFVLPHIVKSPMDNRVKDGDTVFFFNFRGDRARQITRAFIEDDFPGFERKFRPQPKYFASMSEYDEIFKIPSAYPKHKITGALGEILSRLNIPQFRVAETEKYAHVTYFLSCGEETPYAGEDRFLVPSPKVPTYDLAPEMSADGVRDAVMKKLEEGVKNQVIIVNFANPDMVGHTGIFDAARRACKVVDECVGVIVKKVLALGGVAVITADHGNAETMVDEEESPHTAHTLNPVPFVIVSADEKFRFLRDDGTLANIAPTLLEILEIPAPKEMSAPSLTDTRRK